MASEPRAAAALLLLGSFSFGYNAATGLHELGHVLGAHGMGATVVSVDLHPLGTSAVAIAPDPAPLWTHASGLALGPMLAGPVGVPLSRLATPLALPLLMTAVLALVTSGADLLAGAALGFGDAAVLIREGVPRPALLLIGGVLLGAGACLGAQALPLAGLGRGVSFAARARALLIGIGPYLAAIAAWNASLGAVDLAPWLALVGAGCIALALIAGLASVVDLRASRPIPISVVVFAIALGSGAFTAMWLT